MTASTLTRLPADVPLGPWSYHRKGTIWIVSRPGSSIMLYRDTEAKAQAACEQENADWRKRQCEAAAPELLAALKDVVAVADRKTDEFDRARAAIAKAEGRAS